MTNTEDGSAKARTLTVLGRWRVAAGASRSLLSNAGSLFGATLLTVGFGAIYWALATRIFPASAVGLAAAAVSAMLLIGQVSTFGLGTVLIGELSRLKGSERSLIFSAAAIAAVVGGVLGAAFITAASWIVPDLSALNVPVGVLTFAIGVGITASGFVLDQAFVGLLRGGLQLLRNAVASITKLVALLVIGGVGVTLLQPGGATIFVTWVIGGVASMALLLAVPRSSAGPSRPLWQVPQGLAGLAVRHHLLNLSILAPGLLLPLVVTAVMSAEANAYFYIAYMIISLGWAVPAALATALYASGSRDIQALSGRVRLAFWLCMGTGVALVLFMLVGATPLLSIFGDAYADQAGNLLRVLSLGIFPVTINSLYVPIARIERRFLRGTMLMVVGMIIEFIFVVGGARAGGLNGIGVGWLIGYSLGVVPLIPTVFRVAVRHSVRPIGADAFGRLPDLESRSGRVGRAQRDDAPADGGPAVLAPEEGRPGGPRAPGMTFAIVTDGPSLSRWQAACVNGLLATPGVSTTAWNHLGMAEKRRSVRAASLEPLPPADVPAGLPSPSLVAATRDWAGSVDVVLDLTTDGLAPGTAEVWRFLYGAEGAQDALRVGMRDVIRGHGVTRVALVALPGNDILREGALRTAYWSMGTELDQMLFEPAAWPSVVASSRIRADVAKPAAAPDRLDAPGGPDEPRRARSRIERVPISALRLGLGARRLLGVHRPLIRHDDWNIGVVRRPISTFLWNSEPGPVTWLPVRSGRYAADPFGIEKDGTLHIVFEDFDQRKGRAVISHTSVDADGHISEPEQALDPGCHASYPYLVRADDAIWMIPETADAAELRLYVAVDFPRRWSLETKLLTGVQVSDPTVIEYDGRWWLFGTSRGRGVDHALRIWHAPRLTGPWSVHGLDPVKTDAGSARPAGTPFEQEGVLYRPGQDSSRRYGGRVVLNRVEMLTPQAYAERAVSAVGPSQGSPYPDGLHTLSAAGASTLIDGNAVHFIPTALQWEVSRRLPWFRAARTKG